MSATPFTDSPSSREVDGLHVAIDGPAGSGKSTVARRLAARLGAAHIDTGAMYRVLTRVALDEGIALEDGPALARRLEGLDLAFTPGGLRLGGRDVEARLRTREVDARVSGVSAHPEVRRVMQRRQREMTWTAEGPTVMEGRDIGSAVLPMARCKIYLDARPEVRARRRALQTGRGADPTALSAVEAELRERDRLDSEREESPLRIAPDAFVVDTSEMGVDEVVEHCARLAEQCVPQPVDPALLEEFGFRHRHYYRFWRSAREILLLLFDIELHGTAHQDVPGSLVFACNHIHNLDPLILGLAAHREIHFLAKKELFWGPFGRFFRHYGVVPIVRGRYDARAFDVTAEALRRGESVAIFPEGTRKPVGRPGPIKRGLGILTLSTGRPYVPCFVRGTVTPLEAMARKRPIELWMGPPTVLRAADALRRRGLDESELHARVGELYLAQIHAFAHRASRLRPRPDEDR